MFNKKTIIKYKYDDVDHFSSGLARVKLNEVWGYIDKAGQEVIPLKYDFADNFNDDFAKIGIKGKYGFVDKIGGEIISPKYDNVEKFSNGLAKVEFNKKYGFIDKTGNEIIPIYHDSIGCFKNGFAIVKSNEKYGYINIEGEIIIPCKFDYANDFVNGYAAVRLAESTGIIDSNGIFTIQSLKISLAEAIKKKYVRFSSQGNGLESIYFNVLNITDMRLYLTIPVGTVFIPNSNLHQNLVTTQLKNITLNAKDSSWELVGTAGMNIKNPYIPGEHISFSISQRPTGQLLSKVTNLLDKGKYSFSVKQASVWIVTSGASYSDMGILIDLISRKRIISNEDYRNAISIVNKAREME